MIKFNFTNSDGDHEIALIKSEVIGYRYTKNDETKYVELFLKNKKNISFTFNNETGAEKLIEIILSGMGE